MLRAGRYSGCLVVVPGGMHPAVLEVFGRGSEAPARVSSRLVCH